MKLPGRGIPTREKRWNYGKIGALEISNQMPHHIGDECISCGSCELECSFNAIHPGPRHMVIDPSRCVDCGSCTEACPVGAITGPAACAEATCRPGKAGYSLH